MGGRAAASVREEGGGRGGLPLPGRLPRAKCCSPRSLRTTPIPSRGIRSATIDGLRRARATPAGDAGMARAMCTPVVMVVGAVAHEVAVAGRAGHSNALQAQLGIAHVGEQAGRGGGVRPLGHPSVRRSLFPLPTALTVPPPVRPTPSALPRALPTPLHLISAAALPRGAPGLLCLPACHPSSSCYPVLPWSLNSRTSWVGEPGHVSI